MCIINNHLQCRCWQRLEIMPLRHRSDHTTYRQKVSRGQLCTSQHSERFRNKYFGGDRSILLEFSPNITRYLVKVYEKLFLGPRAKRGLLSKTDCQKSRHTIQKLTSYMGRILSTVCAIISRGLYIFYPIMKNISLFSRRFFQKILFLCMASIQELFLIKSW